ncbi:MAG: ATP-binding protein [Solirubrobacterales bacterium]
MPIAFVERALELPQEVVGSALLELPEDQWFDRKSARIKGRELAHTLIAMANAEGGVVVVGLHAGAVEGTDGAPDRRNEQMQASADFCRPAVRAKSRLIDCVNDVGNSDKLLVVTVSPGESVHANERDDVYLRMGDENRRLSFDQRQELVYDRGQVSYETRAVPQAPFDDLDQELLRDYAESLGTSSQPTMLEARGLAVGNELTIAGCLLFLRHPQTYIPESFIRVLRYRGSSRGSGSRQQLIEDHRVEGPIPRQLREAQGHIASLQPVRRALQPSGQFGDVALVPEDAWLEGLVNAAIHRSYSVTGDHIRVEVFDDRIEISSPGRFPGLVDLTDPLRSARFARNPHIARVCSDLNFGQELGEGIRRMFEEMRHAGLGDPVYRQTAGSVILMLSAEPLDRELEARLPEHGRAIMTALREAGRLSTGEVADTLDVSRPIAQRQLAGLRDAGVIEWIGKSPRDPRAYWRLKPT